MRLAAAVPSLSVALGSRGGIRRRSSLARPARATPCAPHTAIRPATVANRLGYGSYGMEHQRRSCQAAQIFGVLWAENGGVKQDYKPRASPGALLRVKS